DSIPEGRLAEVQDYHPARMLMHLGTMPWRFATAVMNPRTLSAKAMSNPRLSRPADLARPPYRTLEVPGGNGFGEVRAVAKAYGDAATGGRVLGLTPATLAALAAPAVPPPTGWFDEVLRTDIAYSLGFLKPSAFAFGSGPHCYGAPGMGGSFGFADPEAGLGFAYAPNHSGFHLWDDPRERALR